MSGMTLEALEDAFMAWVKSKAPAEFKAVWDHQNAPKAGAKGITLGRRTPYIRKIGRDVTGTVNPANGTRKVLGTRELALEFRAYGKGAAQVAEDIRTLLDDETVADALIANALSVANTGDVQNLNPIYGTQFKEVANFEITLRTHSLREGADAEAGVGYIQDVDLEVTTKSAGQADVVETLSVET